MTARLLPLTLALGALAACARPAPQPTGAPLDLQREALPTPDPAPAAPAGPAQWSEANGVARYGPPGAEALITLECRAGRLIVTRPIAAELGASALFAIEGPHRVVRLPVDATPRPGARGYIWQGSLDAHDPDTDVFTGPFTGTLPGGGLITVPPGEPARTTLHHCKSP